jgi:hypothetical protein
VSLCILASAPHSHGLSPCYPAELLPNCCLTDSSYMQAWFKRPLILSVHCPWRRVSWQRAVACCGVLGSLLRVYGCMVFCPWQRAVWRLALVDHGQCGLVWPTVSISMCVRCHGLVVCHKHWANSMVEFAQSKTPAIAKDEGWFVPLVLCGCFRYQRSAASLKEESQDGHMKTG